MAIEPLSSKEQSPRALIERLHGYVTGVSDRKGYIEALQEIEARLTPETSRDADDAARYRFLREPGNAIVYAQARHAWGKNASGHVHYRTPEELDAAVDAARAAEKAGAFCSRCGGTDPACYICGSNAQKTNGDPT
jgi:hypothetical protein